MSGEIIRFKTDIVIEKDKEYMLFYDTKNKLAEIKEVVGYKGNQPIFKNLEGG